MTRVHFQSGRLRLRLIVILSAYLTALGAANLLVLKGVDLSPEQWRRLQPLAAGLWLGLMLTLNGWCWIYLRPVAALLKLLRSGSPATEPQPPIQQTPLGQAANHAALHFPRVLSHTAAMLCSATVLCGGILAHFWLQIQVEGICYWIVASIGEILFSCALCYILARVLLHPLIAYFGHQLFHLPGGLRVRSKLSCILAAFCLAAMLPTAMLGLIHLRTAQAQVQKHYQRQLSESLAYGATILTPDQLSYCLASINLPGEARIRLEDAPGPTSSPLPTGQLKPFIAVIAPDRPAGGNRGLMALLLVLSAFSLWVARAVGGVVATDVQHIVERVKHLAEADLADHPQIQPLVAQPPQLRDLQNISLALNTLLTRTVEIAVTHFLAIEKTIEVDRLKNQFLANVSHDLRSPLNGIIGFSELLLLDDQETLTTGQRELVRGINRAGKQLHWLINDVLDSAKIEAGRITLSREETLPATLLAQALQESKKRGMPPSITIETQIQAGLQPVYVDGPRLIQALAYLIQFSVKSMVRGELRIKMGQRTTTAVDAKEKGKRLRIQLILSHGGPTAKELKRLFHGFYRKPGQRGLGLELALAKSLIELHQGSLAVTPATETDTSNTLVVEIPLVQPRVLARIKTSENKPPPGARGNC